MHIIVSTVRTDAFREIVDVALSLSVNKSTPRADTVAALDKVDAYDAKYPARRWGVAGPRDARLSDGMLRHSAR